MQLVFFAGLYYLLIEILLTIAHFYIVCYYIRLKVNKLTKRTESLVRTHCASKQSCYLLRNLVHDFDYICSKIFHYNKFWSSVNLYIILTMIPVNLCSTNLTFSLLKMNSEFKVYIIGTDILMIVYTWIFIFFISYCMADISYNIHKNYKNLLRIQYGINDNIRIKFKLLNSFERIGSQKKIGFEVKHLFVMTYPVLYRVSHFH